jgi:hypothetical protein
MPMLDLITVLCVGLMTGNELAVSLFVNPAIWKLEEAPQARALSLLAQSLGKTMPFWYFFVFASVVWRGLRPSLRPSFSHAACGTGDLGGCHCLYDYSSCTD